MEVVLDEWKSIGKRATKYFIELVGLRRVQPYAPLRVLSQLGITQDVPLRPNIALFENPYNEGLAIPRARELLREW